MSLLFKLDNLIEGSIIKRPSKLIKSPYVADIKIGREEILGHTASLGCCGLANENAIVLIAESKESKTKPNNKANLKCSHIVYLSFIKERDESQIIGIHPKLAEKLTESALNKNLISSLKNIKKYKKETVIYLKDHINSRFDFTGIDENGLPFILEVKNVPLADYEDLTEKDRIKMDFSDRSINSKIAYFPDGYRKKTSDPVSPRALKHLSELTFLKKNSNIRCIMCYVIQRTDVQSFQPSIIDQEYRSSFKLAMETGVEIITMVVKWTQNGEAYFITDNLPINEI